MKKYFLLLLFSFFSVLSSFAQFSVAEVYTHYEYTLQLGGTGIETVYIFENLGGAEIHFESNASDVRFYRYTTSRADKEPLTIAPPSAGSKTYIITNLQDSRGYIVEENGLLKNAVWIINYPQHLPVINSIDPIDDGNECTTLKLMVNKSDDLFFYAQNGGRKAVKRRYDLSYNTLKWDDASTKFIPMQAEIKNLDIGTEYLLENPPLVDTEFTLTGDQVGLDFQHPTVFTSAEYEARTVRAHIEAENEERDESNMSGEASPTGLLGGSAPVTISFMGYGNEPVAEYFTWMIFKLPDKKNYIARYTDQDFDYEFNDSGDYIVQLEVANRASNCIDTTSVSFSITTSFLDIPNFFSPQDSPGINDEFRVAYKSLVTFKCTIFNRWGVKMYEWTDPAKGWDGKYKGSYVKPGVYFYIIEAKGADGKRYKKGGDINIL